MKNTKIFLILLLVVALAFTLVSCGGDVSTDPDTQNSDTASDIIPDNPTPEDPTPEDPTPDNPTPEDPTPEDPTPEDPTPEDPTPEDPTPEDPTPEEPTPEEPTLKDITDVSFESVSFDYDGQEKTITVNGTIPSGVVVSYSGNTGTDAGEYKAIAVLSGEGYNTLTLNATLIINKIDMAGISFSGGVFTYDTQEHEISITGNVPNGASVVYTGGENGENGATSVGNYKITVTVSCKNYNTYTETANLVISSLEEDLSVFFFDGNVYFQNSLHNKNLYAYDGENLNFIGRDKPKSMITVGGEMYYISNGLFSSGIFSYDPKTNKSECLFEVRSADELVSDGTYLYYNVNTTFDTNDTDGIYCIKINDLKNEDAEITPIKLASVKSGDMVATEGGIYFSNKTDGGKLYSMFINDNIVTLTKIYDYKVFDLVADGGYIYFVRDITLSNLTMGAAIYSIKVDGGLCELQGDESELVTKITMSKGKNLTIIGDYIYFVNTDMVTSTIFGDGIYRASKDGSGWVGDVFTNLVGATKVVDGENDKIFGLTTNGEELYYYRTSSKHLYSFDVSTEKETDLMDGFEPPVVKMPILTCNEKSVMHNGEIYYINMNDGGKLYKYNPTTGLDVRITNLSVADLAINGDVLYYSTVRFLVNFDLYRMNVVTGEMERISTDKCKNFSFYDGKLYYTNFSGKNTLNVMDLETLVDTELFGKDVVEDGVGVDDGLTTVYDGKLYFVADSFLYSYDLESGEAVRVNKNLKPLEYIIHDGKILMMNCDGSNNITVYDIAEDNVNKIGNISVLGVSDDLQGMFVYKNEMYFYRNIAAGSPNKGLYKIASNGDSYEVILVDKIEGYYMCESIVIGDKVYFLDVWQIKDGIPTSQSTAKLCVLDMTTMKVVVLN